MEYKKGQNYYHCAFSRRLIRSKLEIFISNCQICILLYNPV